MGADREGTSCGAPSSSHEPSQIQQPSNGLDGAPAGLFARVEGPGTLLREASSPGPE